MKKNPFEILQEGRLKRFLDQKATTGLFDGTVEVENKIIHVNKYVLMSVSPFFFAAFSEIWQRGESSNIVVESYSYSDLMEFFKYLYAGDCEVTEENVHTLVDMAEFYGVQTLKNYCENAIATWYITRPVAISLLELSCIYNMKDLMERCFHCIFHCHELKELRIVMEKPVESIPIEIITRIKHFVNPKLIFEFAFDWSNIKAEKKTVAESEKNIDPIEAFKAEYRSLAYHIDFAAFEKMYIIKYAETASWFNINEFQQMRQIVNPFVIFKITNSHNQVITGKLPRDDEAFGVLTTVIYRFKYRRCISWETPFTAPPLTSYRLFKIKNRSASHRWYLLYDPWGKLFLKHHDDVKQTDFIICQMFQASMQFDFDESCDLRLYVAGKN